MRRAWMLALPLLFLASGAMAQQNVQRSRPPSANVRLTFHLIEANGFAQDDAQIRPIVTELRKLFRFQGYRLLSTSMLQGSASPHSSVSQQVADDENRRYEINSDLEYDGDVVRVGVRLLLLPEETVLINASVSLQDGKTVVLGSARVNGETGALILAVTPTINP